METPTSTASDKTAAGRRLQLFTLAYLLLYPIPWVQQSPTPVAIAASVAGIGVFLPLYFAGYGRCGWSRLPIVAAILCVGFALIPFGGMWSVFIVYAASMAGFGRPTRVGVTGVALVLAVTAVGGLALHLSPWDWGFGFFFAAMLGVASILGATINHANEQLVAARDAARHLAVAAERERIARDLHDVLGHTLTLVAVKADLARRLIDRDPAAARRELDEIHGSARAALAEVRAAVTGMRSTTLAAELSDARRALESAGIVLESVTLTEPLPPPIETALAYVIREAATNVIRHSGARHCRITLAREGSEAALEIADDGRGVGSVTEGNGVTGMRQRLAAIRGALEIRREAGIRILARVPLTESPP